MIGVHRGPRAPASGGWLLLALLSLVGPTHARTQEGTGGEALAADEIVRRALDTSTLGFQSGEVHLHLAIRDARGAVRERQLGIRSLQEDGQNRALVRLTSPAAVAGQSYLFLENLGGDDDIWIYLPALDDAPRRISGAQREESFLGTNLTYADLAGRDVSEGSYVQRPDEEIANHAVYVIDAVADDSAYESIRLWIRKDDFIPLRIRFFGAGGSVEKTLFTEQVDNHQGRTYVARMSVTDQAASTTTLVVESIDFEADVSPLEFTLENLTR